MSSPDNAVPPAEAPPLPINAVPVPATDLCLSRPFGWVLVVASLVTLVSLYIWVSLTNPEILGLDLQIHDLAARGALPGSGRAMAAMSKGTNTAPLSVASFAVAAGIGFAFSLRRAAVFASMIGLSALTVTILKELVARTRPEAGSDVLGSFAWPSGHSAGALTFALALTVALCRIGPRPGFVAAIGFIPAALLVGYSRIFLSDHWFSDVAAGFAVSVFAVGLVLALQTKPARAERHRPVIAYGAVLVAVSVMVTMGLR